MTKRKILKDFVLTEISGVDRPAQPTAKMSIMKRQTDDDVIEKCQALEQRIEKSGYGFLSYLRKEEFNEESWDLVHALKCAMADAVAVGDMGMMVKSLNEFMSEIMSRCPFDVEKIEKAVNKAQSYKTEDGKEFTASDYAYVPENDKPSTWKLRLTSTPGGDPDKQIVGAAVAALGQGFRGSKVEIPDADLADVKAKVKTAWMKANPDKEEVPDILKSTDEGVAMSEVEDLKKQLEEAQTLAKMSDAEKMYMNGMDEKMKKEFMGLTPEDRKKKMEMTKRDDETLEVDGVTISKSAVGADMFTVMKSQQAALESQKQDIAKAQARAEMAELTKRASDEFSHLSGEASEVAMLLKHVEAMPEDVKKTALAVMKSAEEMNAKAFKSQGTTLAKSVDQTAEEEIDTLTKAYVEKNSVDYATAYTAVITANPELYKRINGQ